jgi:hypothetical protein
MAILGSQHDDIWQIIFACRIGISDSRQQRPQIPGARRHQAGIA